MLLFLQPAPAKPLKNVKMVLISISGNVDNGPWKRFLNFGDVLDFEKTLNFALFKDQSKLALI